MPRFLQTGSARAEVFGAGGAGAVRRGTQEGLSGVGSHSRGMPWGLKVAGRTEFWRFVSRDQEPR